MIHTSQLEQHKFIDFQELYIYFIILEVATRIKLQDVETFTRIALIFHDACSSQGD